MTALHIVALWPLCGALNWWIDVTYGHRVMADYWRHEYPDYDPPDWGPLCLKVLHFRLLMGPIGLCLAALGWMVGWMRMHL